MKRFKFVRKEVLTKKNPIEDAMGILSHALQNDPDYRLSWQANLACAIMDNSNEGHKESNKIADIILKRFFDA